MDREPPNRGYQGWKNPPHTKPSAVVLTAVIVTGNPTNRYNCLAWTLGISTNWIWPWGARNATKAEFDAFYYSCGFNPSSSGPIAVFGLNVNEMTHGSVSGGGHGPRWESKCGAWLRIQHGLAEMEGGFLYGNVLGFYSPSVPGSLEIPSATLRMRAMKTLKLSKAEREFLEARVRLVSPASRNRFDRAYREWKETWAHPLIAASSNPAARTHTPEFLELISLGTEIIPLLMEKLLDPDEFFALQAVDRLIRPEYVISKSPGDPSIFLGEQGRAFETVKQWIRTKA
jgi:hypothetical protein